MQYYRLYNIDNNRKSKNRGFWYDKKSGKTYTDNIFITKYSNKQKLIKAYKGLFVKGEKCIFYTANNKAYLIDNSGKITILKNRVLLNRQKLSIKECKTLLKNYGGFTVFNCKKSRNCYFIEVYF